VLIVKAVLGNLKKDTKLRSRCSRLDKLGRLEHVLLEARETQKSRLRTSTEEGTELGIVMERGSVLMDGDVLLVDDTDRLILVSVKPQDVMSITIDLAVDPDELIANAVRLGHVLGNQHWPIKIEGATVHVPVSLDRNVMETVLRTYSVKGIQYEFKQVQIGAIPQVSRPELVRHGHDERETVAQ